MYAKKANKSYQIETVQEMQQYLSRGFDIFNEQDEIVKHNPSKTVAYTEYQRLMDENQSLLEVNEQAQETIIYLNSENAKLRAEVAALYAQPIGEAEQFAALEGQTTLPPEEPLLAQPDEVKTLAPSADDSAPKMGAKASKAKASADKADSDAK